MSTDDSGRPRAATPQSVFEGTVIEGNRAGVTLLVGGATRALPLAPAAVVWRGGQVDANEILPGDRLLVRLDEASVIERAWANLTRELGAVKERQYPYLTLRRRRSEVSVLLSSSLDAPPGAFVDVIGLRTTSGTIRASSLSLIESETTRSLRLPELPTVPVAQTFTGVATWFDCPSASGSRGKCGTCATSESNQAAWPHTALADGSAPCDRTTGCRDQPVLRCGESFVLTPCNGTPVTLVVVDCGPCQNGTNCRPVLCSRSCNFPPGCSGTGVVVDLTKPTFARFFDPAEIGCFVATVTV